MSPCQVCGEDAIIEDEGTDGCIQKVCAECGVIQSTEMSFCFHEPGVQGSDSNWLFNKQAVSSGIQRMLCTEKELAAKKSGLENISRHGAALGLSAVLIEESKQLFTSSYKDIFIQKKSEFKLVLAAVCIYCVCRLNRQVLLIRKVCDLAQISASDFNKVFLELRSKRNLVLPQISIGVKIASTLNKSKWDNPNWIINRTQDILLLVDKLWILTGRNLEHLITTATFLAWLSQDYRTRGKTKFTSFCLERGYVCNGATKKRIAEMRKILFEISESIPWVRTGQVSTVNVPGILEDIIKYKHSLLYEYEKKTNEEQNRRENPACVQRNGSYESSLLPPSVKKARLCPVSAEITEAENVNIAHDMDNKELTEDDISEKDLGKYIKSLEEIKASEEVKTFSLGK